MLNERRRVVGDPDPAPQRPFSDNGIGAGLSTIAVPCKGVVGQKRLQFRLAEHKCQRPECAMAAEIERLPTRPVVREHSACIKRYDAVAAGPKLAVAPAAQSSCRGDVVLEYCVAVGPGLLFEQGFGRRREIPQLPLPLTVWLHRQVSPVRWDFRGGFRENMQTVKTSFVQASQRGGQCRPSPRRGDYGYGPGQSAISAGRFGGQAPFSGGQHAKRPWHDACGADGVRKPASSIPFQPSETFNVGPGGSLLKPFVRPEVDK
jgi:hypothetical protein